jgi:hypothetical protein
LVTRLMCTTRSLRSPGPCPSRSDTETSS